MASEPGSPGSLFPVVELEGGVAAVRAVPLEAALPGVVAVFSTRRGGVSSPPWNSLNLGHHVGDSPADVAENRRRFFRAVGIDPDALVTAGQVHSDVVAVASAPGFHAGTDGLATLSPGLSLAVFCADCVPIWLLDPVTPAAAVVHAGWKGSLAGIAGRGAKAMAERLGSRPQDILAAIGPSIGPCCFEVGPEVWEPAKRLYGPGVLGASLPGGKARLDLWEVNRLALLASGLAADHVWVSGLCTSCGEDLFHSHRRETRRMTAAQAAQAAPVNPREGRMAAIIRLPRA